MAYTPGSFTKNFSWHRSYKKLHKAIRDGFFHGLQASSRDTWRHHSGIADADRQLIPLNFFLYTTRGLHDDYILVDRLVERAVQAKYDEDFAHLSLFAFHLAQSGSWHRSKWHDGRVAGWANDLICAAAWLGKDWSPTAFEESQLSRFLDEQLTGQPRSKTKVLTNYRYMLTSAGVLADGELQPANLRAFWIVDAVQLFWDRQIFSGQILETTPDSIYEDLFFAFHINRLLRCDEAQGRVFVKAALRIYSPRKADRFDQLNKLKKSGLLAA